MLLTQKNAAKCCGNCCEPNVSDSNVAVFHGFNNNYFYTRFKITRDLQDNIIWDALKTNFDFLDLTRDEDQSLKVLL